MWWCGGGDACGERGGAAGRVLRGREEEIGNDVGGVGRRGHELDGERRIGDGGQRRCGQHEHRDAHALHRAGGRPERSTVSARRRVAEAFRMNVLRNCVRCLQAAWRAVRQGWCVARSAIPGVGCGGTLSVPQSTDEDDFKAQVDALKARQEVRPILRDPSTLRPRSPMRSLRGPTRAPSQPLHRRCESRRPPHSRSHPSLRRARRVATAPSAGTPPAPTAPSSRIPPTRRPRARARPSPPPSGPPTLRTLRRPALPRRARGAEWSSRPASWAGST